MAPIQTFKMYDVLVLTIGENHSHCGNSLRYLARVARLQNEVCAKYFFRAKNFMLRKFARYFFGPFNRNSRGIHHFAGGEGGGTGRRANP